MHAIIMNQISKGNRSNKEKQAGGVIAVGPLWKVIFPELTITRLT
ncbi:MAG: hypothetical protein O7C62_03610 [Rickettsia endosymbiont of Ixodes persulcatus]|nr:hypothetical protein [Rickettsia endosymbiont of Ixodes persulcatus]